MSRSAYVRRVVWYVISGILFMFTGFLLYFHIFLPALGGVLLVVAGAVVIFLGLLRYHPTPDALGVFILSLIVFGLFTSGPFSFASENQTFSFNSVSVRISTSTGSVAVTGQ